MFTQHAAFVYSQIYATKASGCIQMIYHLQQEFNNDIKTHTYNTGGGPKEILTLQKFQAFLNERTNGAPFQHHIFALPVCFCMWHPCLMPEKKESKESKEKKKKHYWQSSQ